MNKSIRALSVLAMSIASTVAFAGPGGTTCATAEAIGSNATYVGDTSGAGYGNPIGGFGPLPSPSNDAIYTYTPAIATGSFMVTAANYNYGIFLTTNCAGTTAPPLQAATGPAVGGTFPVDTLTVGQQYFVIMSSNPSDSSAPNGSFAFLPPFVPVELQSFSID